VLATGGEDGWVYLRNLYDYELITCIHPVKKDSQKIIDIKFSPYDYLYVVTYERAEKTVIYGYTVNGLLFTSLSGNISNLEFTQTGKLIVGYYDSGKINIFDGVTSKVS
jgi:WD40 repeat protein